MVKLQKKYEEIEQFSKDYEMTLKNGGVLVECLESIQMREPVAVDLYVEGKSICTLDAEAVYQASQNQIGVAFKGDWESILASAFEKNKTSGKESNQLWGKDSESLYHAVATMNVHEKIQLAIKGGKEERRLLMKEAHYCVHPYVLKNPRITIEEVTKIARMPSITGEMIQAISNNSDWMHHVSVKLALVKNPKTPNNLVQKYIGGLADQELIQIAKSEHVKDAVSKMAIKTLASRGKTVVK